jgi:glycine hydroxymethyltransferase
VKSLLLYDASHVLGLIAGGKFQPDPLYDGVDIMYGSTHKTFFGPQGGIIVTNDEEIYGKITQNITWRTMDNAHWNRIAALAQALCEMEKFGADYARQTVDNAKALGKALLEHGFPIKFGELGYTQSHQLAIDSHRVYSRYNLEINEMAKILEKSNIIVDAVGRLGTNELTRLGMKQGEMERIAELVVAAVRDRKDVGEEARLLRKNFEIEYCFK